MQPEHIIPFALVGLGVALTLFMVIRNRGIRGALFGAPLRRLVSEIKLETGILTRTKLKVHILDPRDRSAGPHIGVEVIRTSIGSWHMSPISLTRAEAQKLADQLAAAARETALS